MSKHPKFETTGYEGKVLEHLRTEKKLSLKQLAQKLGRCYQYIRVIEKGTVSLTWPVLRDLMVGLGLSPWLFFYASERRSSYSDVKLSQLPEELTKGCFYSEECLRNAIGYGINFLREAANLSIAEFAELMRLTAKEVKRIEEGKGKLTLGIIQEVCTRFNLPLWYLFLIADRQARSDKGSLDELRAPVGAISAFKASPLPVLDAVVSYIRDSDNAQRAYEE